MIPDAAGEMISRRQFLSGAVKAGFAAWLGTDLLLSRTSGMAMPAVVAESAPEATRRGILELRLKSVKLEAMQRFYSDVLGFKTTRSANSLTVRTGETIVTFESVASGQSPPNYHVAWAIPQNKLPRAKEWLAARTPLLHDAAGRDEFYFERVNRTGIYFADPAGNVLEFIARHDLGDDRPGSFELSDILYVNHVGLAVDDVLATIRTMESDFDIPVRSQPWENFAQVGDGHRHLVFVKRRRLWIPERVKAADVYPTDVVLHGARERRYEFEAYPYRLSVAED